MPDQSAPGGGTAAVHRLAERFLRQLGWPGGPSLLAGEGVGDDRAGGDGAGGDGAGGDGYLERLARALDAPREADVRWWRAAAECWLSLGQPGLARWCADQARELVVGGAAADWTDLAALAALAASVPSGAERAAPPAPAGRAERASREARGKRLATAFEGRPAEAEVPVSPADAPDYLGAQMLGARGTFSAGLARAFYAAGEYRIVVEQFLALVCGGDLVEWRGKHAEELFWCGRSLLRLDDRASAFACFALAVGSDAVPVDRMSNQRDSDPDQVATVAARYVAALRGEVAIDTAAGELRLFGDGARLAQWLVARQMEGLFPDFADRMRTGPLRDRPAVLVRQMSRIARDSGWFAPSAAQVAEQSRGYRHARLPAAPPPPSLAPPPAPAGRAMTSHERRRSASRRARRIRSRSGWGAPAACPGPDGLAARQAGPGPDGVRIPIGVRAGGGAAGLDLAVGSRAALIGPPFDGAMLAAIGAHLRAGGWTPVLVSRSATAEGGAPHGWLRVEFDGVPRSDGEQWLPALKASAALRSAVRRCLGALLPACPDPSAPACLEKVVESLADSRVSEFFFTEERKSALEFAAWIVDGAAGIRYDTVSDLRRAAVLVDYVRAAVAALSGALPCRWPAGPRPAEPGCAAVCLELPGEDGLRSALRLTLLLGTLAEAAQAAEEARAEQARAEQARAEEARSKDGQRQAAADFENAALQIRRRPDGIDEEVQRAATAALRAAADADEGSRAAAGGDDNPWVRAGVVDSARPTRVCVLVADGAELALRVLGEYLAGTPGPQARVIAARRSAAVALAASDGFTDLLIGSIPADQLALCEIAAGVSLGWLRDLGLGDRGAVLVRHGECREAGEPLVIWPVRPPGGDPGAGPGGDSGGDRE